MEGILIQQVFESGTQSCPWGARLPVALWWPQSRQDQGRGSQRSLGWFCWLWGGGRGAEGSPGEGLLDKQAREPERPVVQGPTLHHLCPLGWAPSGSRAHMSEVRGRPVRLRPSGEGLLSAGQPAAAPLPTPPPDSVLCAGHRLRTLRAPGPAGPWELLEALVSHRGGTQGPHSHFLGLL